MTNLSQRHCNIMLCHFILLTCLLSLPALAITKNGFDLSGSLVPANHILHGGPPKDGIPAIDHPRFVMPDQTNPFLQDHDRILGVYQNNVAKAYPIKILNWHEIVNDTFKQLPVVVTYCPLCGTGMVFNAALGNNTLQFGVSGLLYNSDVLLYDRQTESLWSQLMGQAITGERKGSELTLLPAEHTTWKAWREKYPSTVVLSNDTGFQRDYQQNPYKGYDHSRQIYFEVSHQAPPNYHPKERVIGLSINGKHRAYPYTELNKAALRQAAANHNTNIVSFNDHLGNTKLTIVWDQENQSGQVVDSGGNHLPVVDGFWFAWFTFHPDTQIYQASQ